MQLGGPAMTIGIFDSGVGGLSIWQQVSKLIPAASTIYLADQKFAPYGDKSPETIKTRALAAINLLSSRSVDLIVIACNTATLQSNIDSLRKETFIPLVGVEPPVKPLAKLTKTNHIAIFCTSSTAKSTWLKQSISHHAPHLKLQIIPAPDWVSLVESGHVSHSSTKATLLKYTSRLHLHTDTIGLGCTHFSYLVPKLRAVLPPNIQIIDTTAAVASHVKHLCPNPQPTSKPSHRFLTTASSNQPTRPLSDLLGLKTPVESINL